MTAQLSFLVPPPGFEPHTSFVLDDVPESGGLFTLRAVDDEDLQVFLVPPADFVADYAPDIDDDQAAELGLASGDDALVLVVANPGLGGVRLNLLAPVVINTTTGTAAQVILDGDYPAAEPLTV